MNKKNSVIIAVILLLLLGTGSFVFAGSPEEKRETGSNNQTNNSKTEKNENTNRDTNKNEIIQNPTLDEEEKNNANGVLSNGVEEETNLPNSTTNNSITNSVQINRPSGGNTGETPIPSNPSIPENPGNPSEPSKPEPEEKVDYEEILNAIKKAETTLTQEDIQNALDLLKKLPESDEKQQLENRLEVLLKEEKLTNQLKDIDWLINQSSSKEDLKNIYNQNNLTEIKEQIDHLPDNFKKEELKDKLKEILEILEDNTAPIINGMVQNGITNQAVTITIDDKEAIIRLDDTIITLEELNKLTQGKENRTFHITATDKAYNTSSLDFTIDTMVPTAEVEYNHDLATKTNQEITAKLINLSEEITITNNEGKDTYTFTENGEFTFEFKDLAGNDGYVTAKVDSIDTANPEYKKMGVLNFSRIGTEQRLDVANTGDIVKVYVTFTESLKKSPTIKLNDIELETVLDEENSTEDNIVYYANYTVDETAKEELATISITNIVDEAGNKGIDLNENDLNVEEHNRIYIIVNPGLELEEEGYFNSNVITIKDPDFAYMIIQKTFGEEVRVDTNTYEITEKGSYTITIYNTNGEIISSAEMVYDNTNPRIKAKGYTASGSETISENNSEIKEYQKVTLEVIDNALKLVRRVDESGNVLEVYKEFIPVRPNKRVNLELTEPGNYIIEAIDGANNKTAIYFNIAH